MTTTDTQDDTEYRFTSEMGEISGFGDEMWSYEAGCRAMVTAGMEWFDEYDGDPEPVVGEFENVTGIITPENEAAEALTDAMAAACEDEIGEAPTGAMMHACVSHVLWAQSEGWDAYVERMTDRARQGGGA